MTNIQKKQSKKTKISRSNRSSWGLFGLVLVVFCILIYVVPDISYKNHGNTTLIIPKKSSTLDIATILEDNHVILNKYTFVAFAALYRLNGGILKAGEYIFPQDCGLIDVIRQMQKGLVVKHKITIPEGYSVQQVINLLQAEPSIGKASNSPAYFSKTAFPEGTLLPETYVYHYGVSTIKILNIMRDEMSVFLLTHWQERDTRIDRVLKTSKDVIILASIVEKEAAFDSEKPTIAGVYINRLLQNMQLQADPTVIYAITNGGVNAFDRRLLWKDLDYNSAHNTYRHRGLPPTPICNPGKASILAALHPEWNEYLYFVANKETKKHLFSNNFTEHRRKIRFLRDKKRVINKILMKG